MMFIFNPPIICIQNVFFVKEVLSFVLWFGAIPLLDLYLYGPA